MKTIKTAEELVENEHYWIKAKGPGEHLELISVCAHGKLANKPLSGKDNVFDNYNVVGPIPRAMWEEV